MSPDQGIGEIARRAESVLAHAGVAAPFELVPITGGGNNRVFLVESGSGPVVLKSYFRHPDDPRDRLRADFGFSSFAWQAGARSLPRPLASDPVHGMAVYEFVAGRKLAPGEVTAAHVAEAAAFFRSVNAARDGAGSADLPEASEACFSVASHVACVDRRMARLGGIDTSNPLGREAADLVASRLAPAWCRVREATLAAAGAAADDVLPAADRCVSPSDFGFHNALLAADGRLRFLDFEYAGHDDPAKMVCDFFCQPAIPVPLEFLPVFLQEGGLADPESPGPFGSRLRVLLPVYKSKWCCILLNEFLSMGGLRRSFARLAGQQDDQLAVQLCKARVAVERLGSGE